MPLLTKALPSDRLEAFSELYEYKLLGAYETISGSGSTLMNTRNVRNALSSLRQNGFFSSILDVGCGDFNWMSALNLHGSKYLGIDIISKLLTENNERWRQPNIRFENIDIVTEVPTRHDLVLCRDLFNHFPHNDIVSAFANIKKSGASYIAVTGIYPLRGKSKMAETYSRQLNNNSSAGYWRPFNFTSTPFNFGKPIISIPENEPGKFIDIWRLADLPFIVVNAEIPNPVEIADFEKLEFFRKLCALPYVDKVVLHGSRNRRTNRPGSDIDLLIHCPDNITRNQWNSICEIIYYAGIGLKVDAMLYCPEMPTVPGHDPNAFVNLRTLYERNKKQKK